MDIYQKELVMELTILLIIVVVLFLVLNTQHGAPTSQMRKQALEANQLLTQAESKLLQGLDTDAENLFVLAHGKAHAANAPLLISEALYGISRIYSKQGNFVAAADFLERALEYSKSWASEKPNFEQLLRSQLESTRKEAGLS